MLNAISRRYAQTETLAQWAIEAVHSGGTLVLRLCLDRVLPVRPEWSVKLRLPSLTGPAPAVEALVETGQLIPASFLAIVSR